MIPDIRLCKFSTYGYVCGAKAYGEDFCEKHSTMKCVSCGSPATHGCDFCGQFVCGAPLCDNCIGATDKGPAGNWGFLNHVHIRPGDLLPSEIRAQEERESREISAVSAMVGANL